jgi:hypothetical protein
VERDVDVPIGQFRHGAFEIRIRVVIPPVERRAVHTRRRFAMPMPTEGGEETVKEDDQGHALLGVWFIDRRPATGRSKQEHRRILQIVT